MRRRRPELWRQNNWLLYHVTVSHFLFHQKQHDCRPRLSSVSPFEDKNEMQPFDKIEVMKVESQAVMNTLTEHDFRCAF
jgi:hypothetical protein